MPTDRKYKVTVEHDGDIVNHLVLAFDEEHAKHECARIYGGEFVSIKEIV